MIRTEEDDEFARIEMEQRLREKIPTGIPFVTQEELEQLLKDDDEKE
jgi:hypothetical protein